MISLIHPDDLPSMQAEFQAYSAGVQSRELELRIVRHDGTIRVLMGRGGVVLDDEHRPILAAGTVHDITDIKRMQAEREALIKELQETLAEVKTLEGFIPICASCKRIRDDQGYWDQVENYLMRNTEASVSHGICPDCADRLYPELRNRGAE